MQVPLSKPYVDDEMCEAAVRVLKSGKYILQDECKQFEKEFAAYAGTKDAVLTNSGTSALFLALKALGVGPGDEILLPSHTAFPTVEPVFHCGATPVFCEIGNDYLVDVSSLEAKITPRTKGILPVHLYGQPADIEKITDIAERNGLFVLEDACQAHGSSYRGRKAGAWGVAGAFSFYPSKNMTVGGDGGILVTNDAGLAERARMLRNHGRKDRYDHELVGHNLRFNEMQAAVGRLQLRKLDGFNTDRQRNALLYREWLADVPVELPVESPAREHVYHLFVIQADRRDELKKHLKERGVATEIHYPAACHMQPGTRAEFQKAGLEIPRLPVTERTVRRILSLPMFPSLTQDEIAYVCEAVGSFYR
jgi:dTDP-4-amino-4,6-dideoxygalactose transaminase